MNVEMIKFWAKTTETGELGIDVYHHMLNVAMVAKEMCQQSMVLVQKFGLISEEIALLSGLHDIGKISPQFQRKCPRWLEVNGLKEEDGRFSWKDYKPTHANVSQFTIERLLQLKELDMNSSSLWAAAIGAHHGKITYNGERGLQNCDGMKDDEWHKIRCVIAEKLKTYFGELPNKPIKANNPALWWVAGLTTVADWIGSDEHFFSSNIELTEKDAQSHAYDALDSIQFNKAEVSLSKSFCDIFPFIDNPNSLQKASLGYIKKPGIYIIEAPMGMGKTEAALGAAYTLLESGQANGIYFALPTQVTSNRIHLRMKDYISNISPSNIKIRLIHGNSWLMEDDLTAPDIRDAIEEDRLDNKSKYDWFASPKRALLSNFGVGTVDQALMGVIAVKHFFVRQFALAGKVVILDEVHSYDMYTGTLIDRLCKTLVELGSTVIVLSATLTKDRRNTLLGTDSLSGNHSDSYPLISGKTYNGQILECLPVEPPTDKQVAIQFIQEAEAVSEAWEKVKQGACLLWICDTVAKSQQIYELFKQKNAGSDIDVGLLHSRFPFFRREEIENEWLQRLGKNNKTRQPCILVATQVVEQSVDIDADLIVTELAPTDMLLQRTGRLWRHERDNRPIEKPELWIIKESFNIKDSFEMTPQEIQKCFGGKAYVYAPYVLLRTWQEWDRNIISIPSGIRRIIEDTYAIKQNPSESWSALKKEANDRKIKLESKAKINAAVWRMPLLEDKEGVMTRVNGQPTVSIILGQKIENGSIILMDNSVIPSSVNDGKVKKVDIGIAVNRNMVKSPCWLFDKKIKTEPKFIGHYINDVSVVSFPDENGYLDIPELKSGIKLKWSFDKGLEIIKAEVITDESTE